jgi:hypothetical protein
MSKQTINIGASPNDGTGTPLRTSFDYTNQNFTELYTALGGGVGLPGATTQVIFNDGGTNLAGDAGLVYNKTTDALTVAGLVTAGSATITGAATVGTTLGVTGVSTFAAGTALLPALTTTGDVNTGIYYPAADTFAVTTGGTERYRVDSAGQFGVGITPNTWSAGYRFVMLPNGGSLFNDTSNGIYLGANYYALAGSKKIASGYALNYLLDAANGAYKWFTSTAGAGSAGDAVSLTQAMTLDASGNLFIGKTATGLGTAGIQSSPIGWIQSTVSGDSSLFTNRLASDGKTVQLYRETLEVGNISVTTTGATFNSTSDYRLKESVSPLTGGLSRVNALKPSVYKWKSNGSNGEGFLAHELAEVVPAAVNGEKDDVNEDGTIKAQSIDMSRIVPILVAAIKELTAEVNALKNA